MPTHEKLRFSAWIQHASHRLEEHDLHYSEDRRVVTCWVVDDPTRPLQSFNNIYWKSHGAGHPGRIRLSTERAKLDRPAAGERAQKHEIVPTPTPIPICASDHKHSSRRNVKCSCEECITLSKSAYRDIYTVKVEVFMPTERGEPVHCSGFLPLDIDIPRCDGKRVSQSSLSLASRTDGNAVTSPTSRGNPPVQTPPIPSKRHAQSLQPEAYVTFYFRYRPQEILPTQRILRSQSCTSHKRTRSPSPYTRSGVSPTPPFKRSRSYPCSVAGSETTQNVDPLTIPYLARLEARKSRSGAGACGRDLSDKDVIMKRAERSISSMPLRDEVFHGVAVQTESEGCRHCSDDYSDVDVDDDDLLIRVEQQLLETHKMLLQLRTNQKKRRRHTTTRAI